MKRLLLIIFGIVFATVSHAATVNWSALPNGGANAGLVDNTAAALAAGNFLRIGYFTGLTDSEISSNAQTLSGISTLNSNFHEFASTTVGSGSGNTAGTFNTASSPLYSSLSGFTPGSQIYFWALKSTNNSSLSLAVGSTTATAIAYVPFANLPSWQFPATDASPASTISVSDLINANAQFRAGTYPSNVPSLNPTFGATNHALQLAVVAVPEPSAIALGAVAAMIVAGRRKRRCA